MMSLVSSLSLVALWASESFGSSGDEIVFGSLRWYVYAGVSCILVLFAGIMSGLTLGLMSLGLVDLEILQRSGTDTEKTQAGFFLLLCYVFVLRLNTHTLLCVFQCILQEQK